MPCVHEVYCTYNSLRLCSEIVQKNVTETHQEQTPKAAPHLTLYEQGKDGLSAKCKESLLKYVLPNANCRIDNSLTSYFWAKSYLPS